MPLQRGHRLGPYEIVALVGTGGMGEVYRARDSRLSRDVALKVLPPGIAGDAERLRRFEKEAHASALLSHPNIVAVYEFATDNGTPFLVTELLEGRTLRQVIDAGAIPLRKAVRYATELARGLAAAHERGIVHRDLKPENVFISSDDHVKILDFGIAKTEAPPRRVVDESATTTIGRVDEPGTEPGLVMGTAGYMAPEQVRGEVVDHRADIFALGAVLFEMLTGTRAFKGPTSADTMSAVLKEQPTLLTSGHPDIPQSLGQIVERCLEKQATARFQSTRDLEFALDHLSTTTDSSAQAVNASPVPRRGAPVSRWLTVAAAAAVGALVTWVATGARSQEAGAPAPLTSRSSLLPPAGLLIGGGAQGVSPARILGMSPDGGHVALSALNRSGTTQLWLRDVTAGTWRPVDGTEGATFPFWSPDGRAIAYYSNSRLWRVSLDGGSPRLICDVGTNLSGGTWNRNDVILFAVNQTGAAIRRVSAEGGTPTDATTLDAEEGESRHFAPWFLPDGRHFFFFAVGSPRNAVEPRGVYVGDLESTVRTPLPGVTGNAQYANGAVIFPRGNSLVAQRFDPTSLALSGDVVTLSTSVRVGGPEGVRAAFSVSANGQLMLIEGTELLGRLSWFDRRGAAMPALDEAEAFTSFSLSADSSRVALGVRQNGNTDVWIRELEGQRRKTRLTFDPSQDDFPLFAAGGQSVVFRSLRDTGNGSVYVTRASGGASEVLLGKISPMALGVSHDGKTVLVRRLGENAADSDLFEFLPIDHPDDRRVWRRSKGTGNAAAFSPDGNWIAYDSNEFGRREVYVGRADSTDAPTQVSVEGGRAAAWRADGKELFFIGPNNRLFSVDIRTAGAVPETSAPRALFQMPILLAQGQPYAVTPDGQRFLALVPDYESPETVTFIQNWTSSLK